MIVRVAVWPPDAVVAKRNESHFGSGFSCRCAAGGVDRHVVDVMARRKIARFEREH